MLMNHLYYESMEDYVKMFKAHLRLSLTFEKSGSQASGVLYHVLVLDMEKIGETKI